MNSMEAFTQLTIFLIVIIALSKLAVLLGKRFGLPTVTIELLTGVLLGPSLLNLLGTPIVLGTWGSPSPVPVHAVLKILAEIGLIQLMFLAGLETDWRVVKETLISIFSVGGWTFILTAVIVAIITRPFVDRWAEAVAVSAIMAGSSFGISTYHITETKLLGSHAGSVILGAAVFSGLLAILLMIASLAVKYTTTFGAFKMTIAVSWFLGKLIMFFAISYFLTSRFLSRVTERGFPKCPRQSLIGYLLLVAALYAWAAIHFGSFAAVGVAALGGALLGMSKMEVKEKISKGFESILASIPLGILFVVLGMEMNLKEAGDHKLFLALLLVTIITTKVIGCWIATRKDSEPFHDRFLIGMGTMPQGEVGMLIAAYLFSRGLVNPSNFNVTIIVVVMVTMLAPVVVKIRERDKLNFNHP